MDEHLIQGGNVELSKDSDDMWYAHTYLKKWFRTNKAIVLYLSDGTLQVNIKYCGLTKSSLSHTSEKLQRHLK